MKQEKHLIVQILETLDADAFDVFIGIALILLALSAVVAALRGN